MSAKSRQGKAKRFHWSRRVSMDHVYTTVENETQGKLSKRRKMDKGKAPGEEGRI